MSHDNSILSQLDCPTQFKIPFIHRTHNCEISENCIKIIKMEIEYLAASKYCTNIYSFLS